MVSSFCKMVTKTSPTSLQVMTKMLKFRWWSDIRIRTAAILSKVCILAMSCLFVNRPQHHPLSPFPRYHHHRVAVESVMNPVIRHQRRGEEDLWLSSPTHPAAVPAACSSNPRVASLYTFAIFYCIISPSTPWYIAHRPRCSSSYLPFLFSSLFISSFLLAHYTKSS